MSFFLEPTTWIWLAAALVSGALLLWPRITGAKSGIGTAEAVRLINREKAVVIDVREPAEFASGHVVGARNVPLDRLQGAKEVPSNKAVPLVLVCATGNRAAKAAGLLQKGGHQQVHVLAGGVSAWREANLPIEKAA